MKNELKNSLLNFIDTILTLKCWHNINELIVFDKSLIGASKTINDYFKDMSLYTESINNKKLELLMQILELYDKALEDDWVDDEIMHLPINKAYLFLKEIKNILEENIIDENIEEELIKRYHRVQKT